MAKINWKNARKFRDFEEKYEPGTELRSGRVVQARKPDSLAARAAEAEKQWIEGRVAKAKKQRQRRRKARQKPSKDEMDRLKGIRAQLGYVAD